ncbi:MAG: hypothetical protein M1827_007406 [Pycnora praestabilis]|nr:MAG: hypothetical protein M1827_007406 [Pycnora praestabilis]
MTTPVGDNFNEPQGSHTSGPPLNRGSRAESRGWRAVFRKPVSGRATPTSEGDLENEKRRPEKWSMGVLNDTETDEVPGSVLLLSSSTRNEPLGLRNQPARTSGSSLPSPYPVPSRQERRRSEAEEKKRTQDGKIILDPQPEESLNDPLNWSALRRDISLLSLGFYCMVGGGMTPVLAAGFTNVAATYHVSIPRVALTTGLYMMGLGVGSVIASPTAILFGKRPVYLVSIIIFCLSAVWCALSPNYASLVTARVFMGLAVSPCECLPSATIAEIFFLHERAYRVGVYTLLLLGGKNLIPLVSAAIIQSLGWRWVFWIVAMIVGFCFVLLFLFVPETFWDRTPRPKSRRPTISPHRTVSSLFHHGIHRQTTDPFMLGNGTGNDLEKTDLAIPGDGAEDSESMRRVALKNSTADGVSKTIAQRRQHKNTHVGFAQDEIVDEKVAPSEADVRPINLPSLHRGSSNSSHVNVAHGSDNASEPIDTQSSPSPISLMKHDDAWRVDPLGAGPATPGLHNFNSPFYLEMQRRDADYINMKSQIEEPIPEEDIVQKGETGHLKTGLASPLPTSPLPTPGSEQSQMTDPRRMRYTTHLRSQPPKTFLQTLKPWNGRLRHDNWFRVAIRPFILFAYPSVLWSALVYSLSVGWLIVLSESVSTIYRTKDTYNFSALGTGLVYLSPFIGGVLGTAVAGKVSDIIVRYMSRRNGGIYEPEFRLVMAIPVAICTTIGLMGYGWSAHEHDKWIVPTVFFGIISFGCSLGSTTAITFCVDSYRQYAGEALVTLNFSKNVFHGLVFSLFFNTWLEADGSKNVFLALGGIQMGALLTTIPMYIYGKRMRMWTVRKNLMEQF